MQRNLKCPTLPHLVFFLIVHNESLPLSVFGETLTTHSQGAGKQIALFLSFIPDWLRILISLSSSPYSVFFFFFQYMPPSMDDYRVSRFWWGRRTLVPGERLLRQVVEIKWPTHIQSDRWKASLPKENCTIKPRGSTIYLKLTKQDLILMDRRDQVFSYQTNRA